MGEAGSKVKSYYKMYIFPHKEPGWLGGSWNTFPLVREEPLRCLNCIGITGCDGWSSERRRRLPCRLFDRDFILLSDLWEPEEAAEYLSGNKMFLYFNWNISLGIAGAQCYSIHKKSTRPVKLDNALLS